ncbi:MerR family transcriptional regulator [Paenibacillus glycanilyticus]|uniref:MerR family transcriptional regulator n=1 Tax=Paenibacillus glycanilyticus TaxID=126569 RepID=UPI000FDADE60|nr:MerR family transcriptional regulator [Paenibacillus glycanilyticus]
MPFKPSEIANRLGISTNALRHYEEWGFIPPVERASNGYRIYTEEHVVYFECIRAMRIGFGMETTVKVTKLLLEREWDKAMWTVNESQAELNQKKKMAEQTVQVLETAGLNNLEIRLSKKNWTIGEVSSETSIPASAIRHWEKAGLIQLTRDEGSGYRIFHSAEVRKIRIIGTLRAANLPLEVIRQVIQELDHDHTEHALRIARESLEYLNTTIREQLRGIYYLYRLLDDKARNERGVREK